MLGDALAQLPQSHAVKKADADARRIRRQAQHVKAQGLIRLAPFATVNSLQQGLHGAGACVGIILGRVAKNVGGQRFKFGLSLGPEHCGGIAHLHPLGRTLAQQVVQCRGVGEGGSATDRGVFPLALGFAVGLEGTRVERDDVGTGCLCAPHALDGSV